MNICNKFNIQPNWFLLSIEDPDALHGKSIINVIKHIECVMNFNHVVIDDIYGAVTRDLIKNQNEIMLIGELLIELEKVAQFDWGDFFLFRDYPNHWNNSTDLGYPSLIAQTDTTIRAIDDTYIYIYTPHQKIVEILKENYKIEKELKGLLKDLEYPS